MNSMVWVFYNAWGSIIGGQMNKSFRANSTRLARYLYSLGFNKESIFVEGKEVWVFDHSNLLQESLDFYFYMRKKVNT